MRFAIVSCLLLATSCSVPSVEELNSECGRLPDLNRLFPQGPADVILGDGPGCRFIPLTVSFVGFIPGCIQLHARGSEPNQELVTQLSDPPARFRDVLVAVLPPVNWGPELDVEVRAFERTCNSAQVGLNSAGVTVPVEQVVPLAMTISAEDFDGDGFVARGSGGTDCWDTMATVFPGAPELCNAMDDDCDDLVDEGFYTPGSGPPGQWLYLDVDGDGHGAGTGIYMCGTPPTGYVTSHQDCDDTASNVHPDAFEGCDGRDNNCNNLVDEAFPNLGTACVDHNGCAGLYQCTLRQDGTLCVSSDPGPC